MRNFRVEDRTEELQSFKGRVEVELEPEIAREIPPESILMEKGQINALADAGRFMDGRRSLQEIGTMVVDDVKKMVWT